MRNPTLLVVAGCNGSGKSTYSEILTAQHIVPFDYDKRFLKNYRGIKDFELRDKMAHNQTFQQLETAIENTEDFCYETNFNSSPMYWPKHFLKFSYQINLLFFCLDSVEKAIERVRIRVENGGHFVPDDEVKKRFHEGYKNLDQLYQNFNFVTLIDSSYHGQTPSHILTIKNGRVAKNSAIPKFLKNLLPQIVSIAA